MVGRMFAFDEHIINVYFHGGTNKIFEHIGLKILIYRPLILQSESHYFVQVKSRGYDERGLLLV